MASTLGRMMGASGAAAGGAVSDEVKGQLFAISRAAGLSLDRQTSDIIADMLRENVTPTGIVKALEVVKQQVEEERGARSTAA